MIYNGVNRPGFSRGRDDSSPCSLWLHDTVTAKKIIPTTSHSISLDAVECGDSSPLSIAAQPPSLTTQPIQGMESGKPFTALQERDGVR